MPEKMKIRKFTAGNTQEAIAKVKYELGSEALIINTKKVRQKGILGYFKKPVVEVMAAIDEQAQAKSKRITGQARENTAKNIQPVFNADLFAQFQTQLKTSGYAPPQNYATQELQTAPQNIAAPQNLAPPQNHANPQIHAPPQNHAAPQTLAPPQNHTNPQIHVPTQNLAPPQRNAPPQAVSAKSEVSIEAQIENIEAMLAKVYREVSLASKMTETSDERMAPMTKVLRLFYNNLVRNEVEPEFSMNIIEKVGDSLQSEVNTCDAATALYNEVASVLGKPETISIRRDKKPTVAIFVGPTGVGKTTTIAKIAADSALNRDLDVAMITADTYRIAAVQQLKTYAEILGIPVSVAYTPGEIKSRIEEFSDKDLVLIDTAGRSHRHNAQFTELRELVGGADADEVFLVLSSTVSVKNNREIIQNYNFLKEFKLIFTKADETPVFGAMLNARILTGKSLSYVTVGQSVPDDIEVASIEKITRNLIGSAVE